MNKFPFIVLVLLTLTGGFFAYKQLKPPTQPLTPVTIRLKWLNQAQFAGIYVAKEKGIYKKYGLEVSILERDPKLDTASKQVDEGTVDFGIISSQELLSAVDKGSRIKAIMAVYQKSPGAIISLKQKNITIPADLKGKTIGIVSDALDSKIFFTQILNEFGLSDKDVIYKVVGFNKVTPITSGKVDVVGLYRTSDLYEYAKEHIEYNLILPENYNQQIYDDVIIASNKNILERNQVVVNFAKATSEGWQYAIDNPDEAINISTNYANVNYNNRDFEKFIFTQSVPLIKTSQSLKPGEMSFERWKKLYNVLRANNLIGEMNLKNAYVILPF